MKPDIVKQILSDLHDKRLHVLVEKYADAKVALGIALSADVEPEVTETEIQALTVALTEAKYELATYANRLQQKPAVQFSLIKQEDEQ